MASKKTSARAIDDNTIRDIALGVLADEGPDALSLPRIAAAGQFTSGPLYRRFDTGADVAADLWKYHVGPYFERVALASVGWLAGEPSDDSDWLTHEVLSPGRDARALIGLLAVARRLGPQGEDIVADATQTLERLIARETSLPPAIAVAHVAPIIGAWLLEPMTTALAVAVESERSVFAHELRNSEHWSLSCADIPYTPPEPPTLATGDPALDDLRRATLRVVSRYGCAGATSNRITREAGRSITSAYRRLGNKEQLVADAIGSALSIDFGFSGSEGASSMPFARTDRLARMVQVLRNQIHPANRANRAFLLESLLAARHEPSIKTNVLAWVDSAGKQFRNGVVRLGINDPAVTDVLLARWGFRIASGLGGLVLSMAAPQIFDRLDPMPVTSASDAVGLAPLRQ